MKKGLLKEIKDVAKDDTFESLLFYMYEYREIMTPLEVARAYFEEVCESSIKLAFEIMEDMKD